MRRRWAIAIAGGVLGGACIDLQAYTCADDTECTSASDGVCEDTGHCSYPDGECESGRRYGDLAAALAGQCTTAAGTTGASSSSDDGPDVTATSTTGGSSGTDSTSEDTGPPLPAECGNGVVEQGEECDDLDAVDGDGCNTDCVRSGSPRWEVVVAGDAGGNDRLFGLTQLAAGDLVAVGQLETESTDVLIMRFTVDGQEVRRIVHDVSGGYDDAEAVAQGPLGDLYVCGRAAVDGDTLPWVGSWNAQLDAGPIIQGTLPEGPTGNCHDVAYSTSSQVVAVGGDGYTAWAYGFDDDDVAGGDSILSAPGGASRIKEVVRGPDTSLYVAGQLAGFGVVYQQPVFLPPPASLGMSLVQTDEEVELQTMAVTNDAIVVGGLLRGVPSVDDVWVAAYELDGSERWRYAPDVDGVDEVEDLALDDAGNVYVIGHRVFDDPDRWVAKLDPEGQLVWQRHDYPGGEGGDRGRSIVVLPDGDLVVVAEIRDAGDMLDGWIARLAP